MKATGTRPKIIVSGDGRGVVGHAVARLLTDVAEVTGLTGACGDGSLTCGGGAVGMIRVGSRWTWR